MGFGSLGNLVTTRPIIPKNSGQVVHGDERKLYFSGILKRDIRA